VTPDPALAAAKAALRRKVLAARDALPPERRAEASRAICAAVEGLPGYRAATTVLAYAAFGSEPDADGVLRAALAAGKALGLPRVDRAARRLAFLRVRDPGADLRPGTWGIREPDPARCPPVVLDGVGLVLVPGVAFDLGGGRLGYGGGYYDRFLAALAPGARPRPWLVAAAFEAQVVACVPRSPTDLPVDLVVTERRVCGPRAGAVGPPG
jgi:5-formyltetrahydrofolate cyclo-ligase